MSAGECELIDHNFNNGRVSPFALPRCRNVYILPGVPHLLQQKWRTMRVRRLLPDEYKEMRRMNTSRSPL